MRILILTVHYHPVLNPNVFRWSAIAEHWVGQGHEVHIVCSRRQGIPDESAEKGVYVHRAGPATLMDWVYNFLKMKRRRGELGGLKVDKHSPSRKIMEQLVSWTWRKIYWPDGSCLWYWPAKKRAKNLLKENPFDAMVSVGLPFTAHWICKSLKEKYPGLRWLVDIEDPFCYSRAFFVNNFRLYQGLNHRAEAIVFSMADAITVTVAQARGRYLKLFSQSASRLWVIPPLFDLSFPNTEDTNKEGPIRLAYFGSFYEKVRTPLAFLKLLRACVKNDRSLLQELEIHFFGELNGPAAETFEKFPELYPVFRFHGLVSRQEAAKAMQSADILLNIGNTTDYHLPSKSVDYLMSGKPVISLSCVEGDPFSRLFKEYPLFEELRVDNREQGVKKHQAERFIDFVSRNRGKSVPAQILEEQGRPYQLENIAERYFQLLTGIQ